MITQLLTMTAQMIIAAHILKLKINYGLIIKIILFFPISLGIVWISKYYISNWIIAMGASIVTSLIIAFAMRIFSVSKIWEIVKSSQHDENNGTKPQISEI
ncbi:MAG: hypothetical protein GX879_02445 [Bacteroidales bacterium]|nr:hypothetical protein [Bacteroidales bacterium]